jgi:hypothetical protein
MRQARQYDSLNRLGQVATTAFTNGGSVVVSGFGYAYNSANQRTRAALADGAYWVYEYDSLGQVVSGKKFWADGTLVAGQQFGYGFDEIGNRTLAKAGGDARGSGLRQASYAVNPLNQYTSRDVPGAVDVLGAAIATNAVLVNNSTNGVSPWGHILTINICPEILL